MERLPGEGRISNGLCKSFINAEKAGFAAPPFPNFKVDAELLFEPLRSASNLLPTKAPLHYPLFGPEKQVVCTGFAVRAALSNQ